MPMRTAAPVCDHSGDVIHRQEVRPMYAASVMGAPLQGMIERLQ
jgi:hypothetical protein